MDMENVDDKTDYLSRMSHEMRTALNIMMASCTLAQSQIDDKDKVLKYLRKIYMNVEQLVGLVDNILDNHEKTHDLSALKEELFCIEDLKHELWDLLHPLAHEKNLDLRIVSEGFGTGEVIGDYGRLIQILINLATNSIKYTPEKGSVIISLGEIEGQDPTHVNCRFICRDTGIGMKADFIEHIFEPFVRANDDMVRQQKGSGLGMYIVKEAVDAMGGNIHIDSMVGAGTTVTIHIMLRKNMRKG